jgi:hypothetical protein
MRRSTVVKKDSAEAIMRHCEKDTASCDIVHGSSRSKINQETRTRLLSLMLAAPKDKAFNTLQIKECKFKLQSPFCVQLVNTEWLPSKQAGGETQ